MALPKIIDDRLRRLLFALLVAAICLLLFPPASEAHAILLRSNPAQDAVLSSAPQQVQMWFSEDLNPALSTATVVTATRQRVDNNDVHVASGDTKEMDLTLKNNLNPGVYIVVWRSASTDDGHVLSGSFLFTVSNPDGSIPTANGTQLPGSEVLGGSNQSGLYTGRFDGPTLFNLIMISLVEIGAVFWAGAQLWLMFVLLPASDDHEELQPQARKIQRFFDLRWSLPLLLLLLIANIGVLVGQALNVTGGQWGSITPALLQGSLSNGRFGTYWLMRVIVLAVAISIGLYMFTRQQRDRQISKGEQATLPWLNLMVSLALLIAITLSGHASAVTGSTFIFAVLIDWLHLLAAAVWIGGMLYIASTYLPSLRAENRSDQANSLLTILPYYSPWALGSVIVLAITGPFNASFHMTSLDQFFTTAYGRSLFIKNVLVAGMIATSAYHVFRLRPALKKEFKKYQYAQERSENLSEDENIKLGSKRIKQQVSLRQKRLGLKTDRLTTTLRWEPLLGIAVLLCVGLMNVFAGTLTPTAVAQPKTQQQPETKPFSQTLKTRDGKYQIALSISPNRFGTNVFTAILTDAKTSKPVNEAGISLYTTMLDMDMGTESINMQSQGNGRFTTRGDLGMSGDWSLRIQVRTPDNTLHDAKVQFYTGF